MLIPKMYQISSVKHETSDVFTFRLSNSKQSPFSFLPGQFNMLYLFGYGEVPISISGDPSNTHELVHTIRAVGSVTQMMQKLKEGDEIGVRGPFGSHWPLLERDCHILIVAGGIGLAPLRPVLFHLAAYRKQYKQVTLLYGARTPRDILYQQEMKEWLELGIEIKISVDRSDSIWKGQVGVVTTLIDKHLTSPQNTYVFLCGPEIMMHFAIHELMRKNMNPQHIYLSMERNMQCALGFCGHCQYGPYFLCKDGPVFSYAQLKDYLAIKEL